MKGQYREGCKGGWGGGRKYNKQGSARKGGKEGRGGKMKGEERRGKGGGGRECAGVGPETFDGDTH